MKNLQELFKLPEKEQIKFLRKVVKKANKDQAILIKIYESNKPKN